MRKSPSTSRSSRPRAGEADAGSKDFYIASRARSLLETFKAKGSLDATYPYPVQVWRLGELTWSSSAARWWSTTRSGSRVTSALRRPGVSGYCNDVMAYIPFARVLKEGGYEGAGAMVLLRPASPWSEGVEEEIIRTVDQLVDATRPSS
jgi:hypothetical protein